MTDINLLDQAKLFRNRLLEHASELEAAAEIVKEHDVLQSVQTAAIAKGLRYSVTVLSEFIPDLLLHSRPTPKSED